MEQKGREKAAKRLEECTLHFTALKRQVQVLEDGALKLLRENAAKHADKAKQAAEAKVVVEEQGRERLVDEARARAASETK